MSAIAEPTTTPAMVPIIEPAIMPPMPMPPPPKEPRENVFWSVPGWRISARVAARARSAGSVDDPASLGAALESSRSSCWRCSGVSFAKASAWRASSCSGGAVRRR